MKQSSNLVFLVPDQWRGDVLGHAGNPAALTPHLDRLVETDAVSFTNAFCQNPVCTPSRCSFMTGWYPHVRGHRSMHFPLQPEDPCLLRELRDAGYYIWWGGKNDLLTDGEAFASICDYRHKPRVNHGNLHHDQHWRKQDAGRPDFSFLAGKLEKEPGQSVYLDSDWSHVLAAAEFIQEHDGSRPFCIFLPLEYPHPPYGVEEPYHSAIDRGRIPARIRPEELSGKPSMHRLLRESIGLDEKPESWWTELRATYYGMCHRVDAQAGLLLDSLKRAGCYDETAFFLFSDHGDYAGDYGLVEKAQNLMEDCLVKVPFILKPPLSHAVVAGTRSGLVELIDFPATVYDLVGITPGYTHFGKSLLPLLATDGEHRDAVFTEGGRLWSELHCADLPNPEETDNLYFPRNWIQAHEPQAHGKAIMCRDRHFKLVARLYEEDELYDLERDPGETRNLIKDENYSSQRERLYKRIHRFFLETADVVPWEKFPRDIPAKDFPSSPLGSRRSRKHEPLRPLDAVQCDL